MYRINHKSAKYIMQKLIYICICISVFMYRLFFIYSRLMKDKQCHEIDKIGLKRDLRQETERNLIKSKVSLSLHEGFFNPLFAVSSL